MAQLHPSSPAPRSSHVLPTVKCSNCALPVPLSVLGEHICPPQQPQPQVQQLRLRSGSRSLPRSPIGNVSSPPRTPALTSHVPFPSVAAPPPRPQDYMPGGESGMAGVGRRAFQAAAHAAVFAQHQPDAPQGSASRRGNPPQFLDIGAAGRGTPPLSPNSAHSSPRSYSPHSPLSLSHTSNTPAVAASPISPSMSTSRAYPSPMRSPPPNSTSPAPSAGSRLPFFQRYKNTLGQTPPAKDPDPLYTPRAAPPRPASPSDSEGSSAGLAYDRDDEDDEPVGQLGRLSLEDQERASSSSYSAYSSVSKTRMTRDDILPLSPRRSHTTPTTGPRGGPGGLPSPLGPSSPPAASAIRSVSDARSIRRDKEQGVRPRVCIRCECTIADGRWVRTDTNKGVLCERCWKNMYLPKCRRCDQPIEKAAVFSSDGQLKGKYHRACFTCHVCRKPFPDKSFYVYDGHPLCAFHYHEANRSLCASRSCGRPIEGPCAVTDSGDRFHPGCLRCEHSGCGERLDDYWEVGGMILCERHAQRQDDEDEEEEEEENDTLGELGRIPSMRRPPRLGSSEARAQKRTTRLINLSGGAF